MSIRITYSFIMLCLLGTLTAKARPTDPPTRTRIKITETSFVDKPAKLTGQPAQSGNSKLLLSDPCTLTAISIEVLFAPNTAVCPGKRPISNATEGHVSLMTSGSCASSSIQEVITVLELSDANGSFMNPVTLVEAPFMNLATGILTKVPIGTQARYAFPTNTPPGTNYLMRIRLKDTNLIGNTLGPFTVLPPDNSSVAYLAADESVCPVQVRVQASGSNMILTGNNGYVYSQVVRDEGIVTTSFPVTQAGIYVLTNINSQPTCLARQNVVVTKNCQ